MVLNLQGGADSWNMLVPLDNCTKTNLSTTLLHGQQLRVPHDLFADYTSLRGTELAMKKHTLLEIPVSLPRDASHRLI